MDNLLILVLRRSTSVNYFMKVIKNTDNYIKSFPEEIQKVLEQLRFFQIKKKKY